MVKDTIQKDLIEAIKHLYDIEHEVNISTTQDLSKGDYTTSAALELGKTLKKNPQEIAEKIKSKLEKSRSEHIGRIEVAGPGFINVFLSERFLSTQLDNLLSEAKKIDLATKSQKIMVEFGDPNPFKEIHIGHLRNLTLGESYARLLSYLGHEVARANYQGDVGMHVAKAIWGMIEAKSEMPGLKTLNEKVKFLAKSYAKGAQKFEESEAIKREITEINKKVYSKDPEIIKYWNLGREWSLKHFEKVYETLGVAYDFYYFESKTAPEGKNLVESFKKEGIFEEDKGSIILRSEKSGLHTRVFISSEGNPTYEAKDLALALMKYKDFPYEESYIITANEQIDYFKVVLKALSFVAPDVAARNFHFSFGFVSLKDGKMSSRLGNVIPGEWLIEETANRLKEKFPGIDTETLAKVAAGAVKYSMLRFGRESDIKFSFDESINLHGNSGPYIQYTFARASSIIKKSGKKAPKKFSQDKLASEELAIARLVCQFETAVFYSANNFSPNILCNYLYNLSTKFNLFYEEHKVLGGSDENKKLALVAAVAKTLKEGLYLLGIDAPDKI